MKRPDRKHNRDQIRYRVHNSIQAAAYLADDPTDQDIDRELSSIMTTVKPKPTARPKPKRCPSASEDPMDDDSIHGGVAFLTFILAATAVGILAGFALHELPAVTFATLGAVLPELAILGRRCYTSARKAPAMQTRHGTRLAKGDQITREEEISWD